MARLKMQCPHCGANNFKDLNIVAKGSFKRKHRSRPVPIYRCKRCEKHFSSRTQSDTKGFRKTYLMESIRQDICSGVSRRQIAYKLRINVKTVNRYFVIIGRRAGFELKKTRKKFENVAAVQFDEMETFCHTKCKPVSIPMVVTGNRFILSVSVCSMPAKGHLAKIARKKYGYRKDGRSLTNRTLFSGLKGTLSENCSILTDECPRYPNTINRIFPKATHKTVPGGRGSAVVGHGEMRAKVFDEMFAFNHTAAMVRDHLATLKRRTWTTTKKTSRLLMLLQIYACYHNERRLWQISKK